MIAYTCLIVTIGLTVTSQVMQKRVALNVAMQIDRDPTRRVSYLTQPLFWSALALLGLAVVSWLAVLDSLDVGKAYTLLSMNYAILVPVSRWVFEERIPLTRWIGAAVITAGAACISWS